MLKAVIFDMDGVIADSEPIYHEVEARMVRDLGIDMDEKEHYTYVGTKMADMWAELKEKHLFETPVEDLVRQEMEGFRERVKLYGGIRPVPGAAELIKELHREGITLAVASSSGREDIDMILKALDLNGYFNLKVSGDEVENGKPAPDIFLRTIKLLGVKPEECAVIEDAKNGVLGAKAAGIPCVGFQSLNSGAQDLSAADLIVESLETLGIEQIRKLCGETCL